MRKVSIITSTKDIAKRNNLTYFYEMFRSIHEQDYPNIEHVIVDGNSDEESLEFMRKIIKKYQKKEIFFISEPDEGINDATNKGFKYSSGDYITLMCDDDFYTRRNSVKILVNLLERNNADFSCGDSWWLNQRRWYVLPASFAYRHPFLINALLLKREIIARRGYYLDVNYPMVADLDLFFDICSNPSLKYAYTRRILTVLRPGGFSQSSAHQALTENVSITHRFMDKRFFTENEIIRTRFQNFSPLTYMKMKLFCKNKKFLESIKLQAHKRYFKDYFKRFLRNMLSYSLYKRYWRPKINEMAPKKRRQYTTAFSRAWVETFYETLLDEK